MFDPTDFTLIVGMIASLAIGYAGIMYLLNPAREG